ncbi:MAG TPA: J domain-containing protein [Naasia sp.]|jgi:hypothetical protein
MSPAEAASLLGVHPDASIADIQQAFQRQARLTHPDLLTEADDAERHAAGLRFAQLREAQTILVQQHPVLPVAFEYPMRRPRKSMGGFGGTILAFLILAAVVVFAVTSMDAYRMGQVQNLRGGVVTEQPIWP